MALRMALALGLAVALSSGGSYLVFSKAPGLEALQLGDYVRSVRAAIHTLDIVFSQADESVKAYQQGWLAPEGAASEFQFLQNHVKDVKALVSKAQPPADMEDFHRQLGRSISLTQQAMDAMEAGFTTGDSSYFQLAHQKLTEARTALGRAGDLL